MPPALDDLLFGFAPAKRVWKPLLRWVLTGRFASPVLRPGALEIPEQLTRLGLYLHVPFCRNLCPYCPYNRVAYDAPLYRRYEAAVHQEIERVAAMRAKWPPIVSLYVGGGTPTVEPAGLARLLAHARQAFGPPGDVCIELHPSAMDDSCLARLRGAGVTMLSIGVESFSDRLLAAIGRNHDGAAARDAVYRAAAAGFDAVNVDLMFALPGQSLEELGADLDWVLASEVDQISTYPIFGFPYTEWGERLGGKGIHRPPGDRIRAMLGLIRRKATAAGFAQCAVWSFLRPRRKKFSSITRHHYLGFGPSAASMTGRQFAVNTFSVEEYAAALPGRLPVALTLPVDRRLEMTYWLYWRAYEMKLPRAEFVELFGAALEVEYGGLLEASLRLGMLQRRDGAYHVTEDAAYWIHRLQNEYSLNYIDRLWGRCRQEAWPREVRL